MTDLAAELADVIGRMVAVASASTAPAPAPAVPVEVAAPAASTGVAAPADSDVWVVVALSQHVVAVSNQLAATPTGGGGRMGIFAARTGQTEERTKVTVVGVAVSRQVADLLVADHKRTHPQVEYDYVVEAHRPVWEVIAQVAVDTAAGPVCSQCIDCGVQLSGATRCQPCQTEFWRKCREADPDFLVAS